MRYQITLKSGVIIEATSINPTRSAIGLWQWALRQVAPQVVRFNEISILSTEIAAMTCLDEQTI